MKLMGASLVETVDSFLHAGYISAYPRPLEPDAYPPGMEGTSAVMNVELDLVEALRLGEPAADTRDGLDTSAAVIFGGGGGAELLLGALTLAGIALLVYLLRRQIAGSRPALVPAFSMMALLVLMSTGIHCGDDGGGGQELPSDPPWEGVTPESYVHPEQATLAILHGIIGPALTYIGQPVETLANLQDEVALPSGAPSEGEAYALTTYGIDGFGNEFHLEMHEMAGVDESTYIGYTVTSAGPDGVFDTEDDISADFDQMTNDGWGWTPENTYYLVETDGQVDLLFHRWNHEMFEFQEEDRAAALTDSDKFDLMTRDRLHAEQIDAMNEAYESMAADTDHAPIVLQVFAYPEG